jgi:rhamnosyltransferase
MIKNSSNKGIAFALSQIMEFSIKNSYDWVLNCDQDTVFNPGLINEYSKYLASSNIGVIGCNFINANCKNANLDKVKSSEFFTQKSSIITSGSLMSVEAYKHTTGYNEDLFIDWVDNDICYKLISNGYDVIKIPYNGFIQYFGEGHLTYIPVIKKSVTNYSPIRRYYLTRNSIYLTGIQSGFTSLLKAFIDTFNRILGVIFFGKQKAETLKAIKKGLLHGLIALRKSSLKGLKY